jgi:hypothetical protein
MLGFTYYATHGQLRFRLNLDLEPKHPDLEVIIVLL